MNGLTIGITVGGIVAAAVLASVLLVLVILANKLKNKHRQTLQQWAANLTKFGLVELTPPINAAARGDRAEEIREILRLERDMADKDKFAPMLDRLWELAGKSALSDSDRRQLYIKKFNAMVEATKQPPDAPAPSVTAPATTAPA